MLVIYAYFQDEFVSDREAGYTTLIGVAETEAQAIACATAWVREHSRPDEDWVFPAQPCRKNLLLIAEEHKYRRCGIYAEEVPLYK